MQESINTRVTNPCWQYAAHFRSRWNFLVEPNSSANGRTTGVIFPIQVGNRRTSYSMGTGESFPGVKRPLEASHLPTRSVRIKNVWSFASTPMSSCWGAFAQRQLYFHAVFTPNTVLYTHRHCQRRVVFNPLCLLRTILISTFTEWLLSGHAISVPNLCDWLLRNLKTAELM